MTTKAYDRITMTCMAAAACSAVLFDKFPQARFAIALLGVLAGAVAVAVYFWNQWTADEKRESSDGSKEPNTPAAMAPAPSDTLNTVTFLDIGDIPSSRILTSKPLGQFLFYRTTLFAAEVRHLEPPPSVEAVVELVESLFAKRGREYEITVHPDGRFTIRPVERVSREAEREAAAKPPFTVRSSLSEGPAADTDRAIAEWAQRYGLRSR